MKWNTTIYNKKAMLALYIIISLTNVFLHIVRSILVIKSGKLTAHKLNKVIGYIDRLTEKK